MENTNVIPFEDNKIRKTIYNEEWFFSVIDVIQVLTDSLNPKRYWTDLKRRSEKESDQPYAFCVPLKLTASDGRLRLTDCANTEGVLRIVMSIPSPKAEPLKLWLAEQGRRAIDETENPELLTQRQIELYKAKGYTDEWIKERLQSIEARKRLTDEWQKRGVNEGQEYSTLTAIIAKGTFGLSPKEHKKFKGLTKPSQNLRDHMTPIELILTSLGEEATRLVAIRDDAQGFHENQDAAQIGGKIGGKARMNLEEETGLKIVSSENFLGLEKREEKSGLPPSE
jgi:DNA-damage-inducible protein D